MCDCLEDRLKKAESIIALMYRLIDEQGDEWDFSQNSADLLICRWCGKSVRLVSSRTSILGIPEGEIEHDPLCPKVNPDIQCIIGKIT
jgi:hypothetical protein